MAFTTRIAELGREQSPHFDDIAQALTSRATASKQTSTGVDVAGVRPSRQGALVSPKFFCGGV